MSHDRSKCVICRIEDAMFKDMFERWHREFKASMKKYEREYKKQWDGKKRIITL